MKKEESLMAPSDKPPVILTYDNIFVNAKSIFVEYFDVLKAPWYTFMLFSSNLDVINQIFDTSTIRDKDAKELWDWYINRKYRNPLRCLDLNDSTKHMFEDNKDSLCDEILTNIMDHPSIIENSDVGLPFLEALKILNDDNIVNNIYIYTPNFHTMIEKDILKEFGDDVKYVYGSLNKVLVDIDSDATYVFSDMDNIYTLIDMNRLDYSSILMPDYYFYNLHVTEDGHCVENVDIDILSENHLFHFEYFSNELM